MAASWLHSLLFHMLAALILMVTFQSKVSCSYWSQRASSSLHATPSMSSISSRRQLHATPSMNGCYNYRTLSDSGRNMGYWSSSLYCDSHLHGWYRFSGGAGIRLADTCQTGLYACSTYYRGWMSGSLPNSYEGEVQRTVYFAERSGSCYSRSTTIWVKNCRGFYIYYFQSYALSCNYRYCGTHGQSSVISTISPSVSSSVQVSSSVSPLPSNNPCSSYQHLSDKSRNNHQLYYQFTCDSSLNGWYRFTGEAGSKLLDRCPYYQGRYRACGAQHQGWLSGSLPSWYEGAVSRTLYFAASGYCRAYQSRTWVKNCGGFYVYYLHHNYNIPCNYRYCAMADVWYMTPSAQSLTTYFVDQLSTQILQPTPAVPKSDACKNYQILSDPTRASSYRDWYTTKCDNQLRGWYRFMGDAGNRMLSSCSSGGNATYRCGSVYQGWLTQSHPSVYEGEVLRTVCFSRYYSCYCEYQNSIRVKNCGSYYVYWLGGTPTCSLRYCGFKDTMSRISCSSNYMRIDLFREYYDTSRYKKITLRNPTCEAYYSSRFITLGSIPNSCGATRKETPKHIVYTNEVILTARQTSDMVTRDHDEIIQFSCKYERDGFTNGASYLPVSQIKVNESNFGSFTFNFEMFTSKLYSSRYYSFPAKVQLRDNLYFQARSSVQDNGLVLLIDQCYSTPTMDRNHYQKYMFINNGCPVDGTVQFHSAAGQQQRFSIQAFRYLNKQSTVFIHCLILLCQNTSSDFRCTSGCTGNNVGRVRREAPGALTFASEEGSYSQYYLLEAGPVVLDEGKGSNDKQGGDKAHKTLMGTVIGLVVGVVALAVIVALMLMRARRNGNEIKREVKEMGVDNAPHGKEYVNDDEVDDKKDESAM